MKLNNARWRSQPVALTVLAAITLLIFPGRLCADTLFERAGFGVSVVLERSGDKLQLVVEPESTGYPFSQPDVKIETTTDPSRLVVDVPYRGTFWPKRSEIADPLIRMIRFGVHPGRLRVVLDASSPLSYSTPPVASGTRLLLAPSSLTPSEIVAGEPQDSLLKVEAREALPSTDPQTVIGSETPALFRSPSPPAVISVQPNSPAEENTEIELPNVGAGPPAVVLHQETTPWIPPYSEARIAPKRSSTSSTDGLTYSGELRPPRAVQAFTVKDDLVEIININSRKTISRISPAGAESSRKTELAQTSQATAPAPALKAVPPQADTREPVQALGTPTPPSSTHTIAPARQDQTPVVELVFDKPIHQQKIPTSMFDSALLGQFLIILAIATLIAYRYVPMRAVAQQFQRYPTTWRRRRGKPRDLTFYYQVLGLSDEASDRELDDRFQALVKMYEQNIRSGSPDVQSSSTHNLRVMEKAYRVLKEIRRAV